MIRLVELGEQRIDRSGRHPSSAEACERVGGVAQRTHKPVAPASDDPLCRHVLWGFDIDDVDRVSGLLQVVEQPLGVGLPCQGAVDDQFLPVGEGVMLGGREQKVGRFRMDPRSSAVGCGMPGPRCAASCMPTSHLM